MDYGRLDAIEAMVKSTVEGQFPSARLNLGGSIDYWRGVMNNALTAAEAVGYTRAAEANGLTSNPVASHFGADIYSIRARLTATEATLAEAAEALRPFADEAREIATSIPDETDFAFDVDIGGGQDLGRTDVTVGDFRRARAALARIDTGRE